MLSHTLPCRRLSMALGALLLMGPGLAGQTGMNAVDQAPAIGASASGLELHPVLGHEPLRVLRVYPDGTPVPDGVTAGENPNERLLYSNTMGFHAIAPGANVRVADDIVVTARDGCKLTRYSFDVAGNINGAIGPYTVSYALMNTCPGAIDSSVIINRTFPPPLSGSVLIPDEQPTTVEIVIPQADGMSIPTNLWLSLIFSRSNAGPIVGAPAQEGFSLDLYHQTGSTACATNFGNFPSQLHGSFNIQLWGGTADEVCPAANIAYHAHRETGPLFNPGANVWVIDDLRLLPWECHLIGYEVTVKGAGAYNFEFRESCDGPAINGTERVQLVATSPASADTRNLRFTVDPPVLIPAEPFFAARMNNSTASLVAAGIGPGIGETEDRFDLYFPAGVMCDSTDALPGHHDALSVTVMCDGAAESGACCDMYVPECVGGARSGLPCRENIHCPSPGTCEVECRELPLANCTFPPKGTFLEPGWEAGDVCEPNPFPGTICGRSACCHLNENGEHVCLNLTESECSAQKPLEEPRQWQLGRRCGMLGQSCPIQCRLTAFPCDLFPDWPGCTEECCRKVCEADIFCCAFDVPELDQFCIQLAMQLCDFRPDNDTCIGALAADELPAFLQGTNSHSDRHDADDLDVCCHNHQPPTCIGGENDGLGTTCSADEDCPGGTCGPRPPRALYTVWYKWIQPPNQTTMRVETCSSSAPATDGIIQAFAPTDNSSPEAACDSLVPIGCSDNLPCGASGKQARMCLTHLVPGNTYYAMVGAKTEEARGDYRVNFTPGCVPPIGTLPNDWCHAAAAITDGDTPFNLAQSTFDCPAHECLSSSTRDIWYNYVATCTGHTVFQTCGGSPDTSLAIFASCDQCPDETTQPIACNDGNPAFCGGSGESAAVSVSLIQGTCYKIRLANDNNSSPVGQLHVFACDGIHGPVVFHDPPDGVIDAGRPHHHHSNTPLGIQEIVVQGPPGVPSPLNWRIDCETAHSDGEPNEIESITEPSPGSGVYAIWLRRPITPSAFTSVRYLGNPVNDPASAIRMFAHPGNVNGDEIANEDDIFAWVAAMNVDDPGPPAPWGSYSLDIDRSGMPTALDLLDLMDLMNGAELYEPQLHSVLPAESPCLPD